MKTYKQAIIDHYINIDARSYEQFKNSAYSADEYCATADASMVALHYLSEHTNLAEFEAAIHSKAGSMPKPGAVRPGANTERGHRA